MKVGEAIVRLLEQYQVDTVFGIPGTHSIELYRGLSDSAIQHILPRHEQGAGFMADGYARSTGKPGVCFVISGPGVTNITTPMAEACHDSVPMLVISPVNRPDPSGHNQGRLHEITSQVRVTEPFTGFSAQVADAQEIPTLIARAFTLFHCGRPQPVHINIPIDILSEEVSTPWQPIILPSKTCSDASTIKQAVANINQATKIVIIAGGGSVGASGLICQLAEKLGAPVITSVAGRCVIDKNHPLHCGAQLRAAPAQQLAKEADTLFIVGTQLGYTDHNNAQLLGELTPNQIRINVDPNALIAPSATDGSKVLGLLGDCESIIEELLCQLEGSQYPQEWGVSACNRVRSGLSNTLTTKERKHIAVLETAINALPDQSIIVSDMTQIAYSGIDLVALPQSIRWHHPTGYGTLGYALPAAIGSKLARPTKTVMVIVGDSGLQYTIQEMAVAAELSLPIIILLWNNNALQQIHDDMVKANISPNAVNQTNPNFIDLAKVYGWHSEVAKDHQDLANAIDNASNRADQPTLIQVNEHDF